VHGRDDLAQVTRSRLLARDRRQAFLFNLVTQLIEALVGRDDLVRQPLIALAQRLHRKLQLLIYQTAQPQNVVAYGVEVAIERGPDA
jgi:hypothetical protein